MLNEVLKWFAAYVIVAVPVAILIGKYLKWRNRD